jgi:hypothetical protein
MRVPRFLGLLLSFALLAMAPFAMPRQATADAFACASTEVFNGALTSTPLAMDGPRCADGLNIAHSDVSRLITGFSPVGGEGDLAIQAIVNANVGGFGAFVRTSHNVPISPAGAGAAQASGGTQDGITPFGNAATGTQFTLVLPFHLTGLVSHGIAPNATINDSVTITCSTIVSTLAGQRGCAANATAGIGITGTQTAFTTASLANLNPNDALLTVDETIDFKIPLVIGATTQLNLGFDLSEFIADADLVPLFNELDFSHTGKLEAAQILDAAGRPVSDIGLQSDSGFDYLHPAGPVDVPVPEPATAAMLAAGLATLGMIRRRRRMSNSVAAAAAVAAVVATTIAGAGSAQAAACDVGGNLVANCGFEIGLVEGGTFPIPSWSGGTYIFNGVSHVGVDAFFNPHSDLAAADFGAIGTTAAITQTIATVAGATYNFDFWYAGSSFSPSSFEALFEGVSVFSVVNNPSFLYEFHHFVVTAAGTSTDITFIGRDDPSGQNLDDVSVTPFVAAVPEPATLALIGAGLLGLGAARRRTRVA